MTRDYPRWWNAHTAAIRRRLVAHDICTTRDLITAVRHHHGLAPIADDDPACVRMSMVLDYCKTHLSNMPLHVNNARCETGVSVEGAKPNSLLVHIPDPVLPVAVEEELPPECHCPLTHDVFGDPVVAADGYTYERAFIEAWFAKCERSPLTNEEVLHTFFVPNRAIMDLVRPRVSQSRVYVLYCRRVSKGLVGRVCRVGTIWNRTIRGSFACSAYHRALVRAHALQTDMDVGKAHLWSVSPVRASFCAMDDRPRSCDSGHRPPRLGSRFDRHGALPATKDSRRDRPTRSAIRGHVGTPCDTFGN